MKPDTSQTKTKGSKPKLLKRSTFSSAQLLTFALIFAAIGGYVLYRSFAASPPIASLEGEQMSQPAGSKIVTDTTASSGKALELASAASTGTTSPTAKPAIPTNLKATAGNGSVTLSWSANASSDQVDVYQVYYGTDSSFANFNGYVSNVTGTTYTVSGLTNGTTYYFRVSAHNSVGYGPWTATAISATPASTTSAAAKPTIPTGLIATAGNGSVTLSWSANPASDQVDVYQVYYGTTASFSSFNGYVPSVTGTSYTVAGLTNGTTYYFRVSAHNSVGYGPWSATPVGSTPTASTGTGSTPSATDLALNKPATASSVESNLSTLVASKAFDGNTATRWSSAYSDPQWVEVDLGSTQSISSVVITWTTTANSWEVAYAKAYQIQTSNDNKTWTTIYSTTTGSGGTQTLSVNGSGRYVRMYGTQRGSQYGYSLWEMAVYGPGTTTTTTAPTANAAVASTAPITTTGTINLPSSATSLTVTAKGDQCNGAPQMSVAVDGAALISGTAVSSTSWSSYSANVALASGNHTLTVTFTNTYASAACARDLYVDVTNFYGPVATTPNPTVSLSVSPNSVTAGSAATLTWSSTNANSCTASGAWSGTENTSGSTTTGALNQTSTYSLKCTNSTTGASASTSVTVTVAASSSGSSGGGGTSGFVPHAMYDSDGTQPNFTADWPGIAATGINTLILPSEWTSNLQTLAAAGDKAWVTAGHWDDSSHAFSETQAQAVADITSACATGVVQGIYVADEPDETLSSIPSADIAAIKTRATALKAACPSAQTIMAYYDSSSIAEWKGVTDAIALDIYPSRNNFNDSEITQLAAAADAAGIKYYGVVGAFTDGTSNYPLPTATQLTSMFNAWTSTNELGWAVYSWGAAGGATSTQLQNQPTLLAVIKSFAAL